MDNVASTIAITLVLIGFAVFSWIVLRRKLYASAVDRALNSSVEWQAWEIIIQDLDEKTRLDIAMIQLQVLKTSYSLGLSPQVTADAMVTAMSELESQLDLDTV